MRGKGVGAARGGQRGEIMGRKNRMVRGRDNKRMSDEGRKISVKKKGGGVLEW